MVTSLEEFKRTREEVAERVRRHWSSAPLRVLIGMGSCGLAAGAQAVCQAMVEERQARGMLPYRVYRLVRAGSPGRRGASGGAAGYLRTHYRGTGTAAGGGGAH